MDKNLLIPNQIIKSLRKSISLIIKHNGDFIVRAPKRVKDEEIISFINQKADWIIKKRSQIILNSSQNTSFENFKSIGILGEEYSIFYKDKSRVKIVGDTLILPKEQSKEKLITFLKKLLRTYLTERVYEIANEYNFQYSAISISSAKTCWGSCSFNNNLHFTYKLALCPKVVVDYLIIHELCHTKIKNHSSKFWDLVGKCCPNYKFIEKWLKENRGIIDII